MIFSSGELQKNSIFRREWLDWCQLNLSLIISASHFTGLQPNHTVCFGIALQSSACSLPLATLRSTIRSSLDIEGAELQVLRSIPWHLVDIEVKDGKHHPLTYNPFRYQNITLA